MKQDRRTRRTEKNLQNSLMSLLQEKDINKITISELSEAADVSRMAFYYHYEDIYALYKQVENNFFAEFAKIYDKSVSHDYRENMTILMTFLRDNANTVRHFANKSEDNLFNTRFATVLQEQFRKIVMFELNTDRMTDHLDYMITYHSAGIYAVYMKWIESDFAWSNEEVLNLIREIDNACDSLYYH